MEMMQIRQPTDILDQTFAIPLDGAHFIIYAPLKKIAFIANNQLISHIVRRCSGGDGEDVGGEFDNTQNPLAFLEELDFFTPTQPPLDEYRDKGIQYDAVVLFLTNQCNLNCSYCYANAGDFPARMMPWEVARAGIEHVMRTVTENGLSEMTLGFHGGGEPTLNWNVLVKSVDFARSLAHKNGIKLHLSGAFNGYWSPSVRQYMVENFTDISLSFDGLEAIQNLQRPARGKGNSFTSVTETLQALDESDISYGIRMTVTNHSVESLRDGIAFICDHFKPMKIQVEPVFMTGRAKKGGAAIADLDRFIDQFIAGFEIAKKIGIELFYSGARPDVLTRRFCLAACRALVITLDGEVTTCFETHGREHPLSDHFQVGCYRDGGFHIDQGKLNHHFSHTVDTISSCHNCFCKWHCAGDCAVKNVSIAHTDDPNQTDRCYVNQELTKFLLLKKIWASGGIIWQP